jgi:hypothetical protein
MHFFIRCIPSATLLTHHSFHHHHLTLCVVLVDVGKVRLLVDVVIVSTSPSSSSSYAQYDPSMQRHHVASAGFN